MVKFKSDLIEAHIIRIKEGKVEYLLLKRAEYEKYPNIWQMVTGKIRNNENAYETALREIKEETQLDIKKLFVVPTVNFFYDHESDSVNLVPVFLALVNSDAVKLSSEHREFKWTGKTEAESLLAWPGQWKSVNIIEDYFSGGKDNLNFIEIDF